MGVCGALFVNCEVYVRASGECACVRAWACVRGRAGGWVLFARTRVERACGRYTYVELVPGSIDFTQKRQLQRVGWLCQLAVQPPSICGRTVSPHPSLVGWCTLGLLLDRLIA